MAEFPRVTDPDVTAFWRHLAYCARCGAADRALGRYGCEEGQRLARPIVVQLAVAIDAEGVRQWLASTD